MAPREFPSEYREAGLYDCASCNSPTAIIIGARCAISVSANTFDWEPVDEISIACAECGLHSGKRHSVPAAVQAWRMLQQKLRR